MSESNFFRLIENYFDGTISATEKVRLENQLSKDPLLKAEFDLQKDINKGLKQYRHAELKSRLAAIDVSTAPSTFFNPSLQWLAGTIASVTLIGAVLYWNFNKKSPIEKVDITVQDQLYFTTADIASVPLAMTENENISVEEASLSTSEEVENAEEIDGTTVVEDKKESTTAQVKPQSLVSFEDSDIFHTDEQMPTKDGISKDITSDRATEVEVFTDKEFSFHYRHFNNKLYLYGDFNNVPYEIIELNTRKVKQLFLRYKDNIYYIDENITEVRQLETVENEKLLDELSLIAQ